VARWKLHQLPGRVATGAFILSSGLDKRAPDDQTVHGLYGFATSVYPFLKRVDAPTFVRGVAAAEIGIGAALLAPFVSTAVAGAALTGFSAGLLGLYLKTPAMRRGEGDLRPSPDGLALAKDVWMLGSGLTMIVDGLRRK
jgi:hypothetical protein